MFQTFGHQNPQEKRFEMTGNQWILGPRNLAQNNRISTKAPQQLMTVSGDHERKGVWNLCRSWVNSQPTAFTISKHNSIRFSWQSACSCASNVLPRSRATRGGTAPNKAEGAVSCKYTAEAAFPWPYAGRFKRPPPNIAEWYCNYCTLYTTTSCL